MAYVKAIVAAMAAALLLGVVVGAGDAFRLALGHLRPEDKAIVLASGVAESVNCAAFVLLIAFPLAIILVFVVRRRRGTFANSGQGQIPR